MKNTPVCLSVVTALLVAAPGPASADEAHHELSPETIDALVDDALRQEGQRPAQTADDAAAHGA